MQEQARYSRFGLMLLALLTLGWGINWPIMKTVLQDVPPLTFRGACLFIGGIGILSIACIAGQSLRISRVHWRPLAILSLTNMIGWNVFAIYGVGLLPSGRAALLGYTMPLWSVLLSIAWLGERMTMRKAGALTLGMAGVFTLLSGTAAAMLSALPGVACMLTAAVVWAAGMVLLKRFALPIPTLTLTGWLMITGGVPMVIAAILLEHDAWRPVSFYPAIGFVYNIFVAFMFCYWAWNRIVLMVPVAVSSLSSLIVPVVGIVSGAIMLGEPIGWREVVATALILSAIRLSFASTERARA
jgi:drug/metabolite transporter (DMT)-like permease